MPEGAEKNFWSIFFRNKSYVINLTKKGLDYTLGDFFANSSGRPGPV
jgi:hypothetical protein